MLSPSVLVWTSSSTKHAESQVAGYINATRDFASVHDTISVVEFDTAEIIQKLDDAFNRLVTMTMPDPTLHILAIVPIYEAGCVRQIEKLYDACAALEHNISLHIICLCGGIRHIFEGRGNKSDFNTLRFAAVSRLKELSKEAVFSLSYSLVDDYAANGAPIGFTLNSLSRYIALFQMALMQNHYSILSPALLSAHQGENLTLGLSTLSFDRQAMINRMLGLSFLGALDDVGINDRAVDIKNAIDGAESVLDGIENRYPDLYDDTIRKLCGEYGEDEASVMSQASEIIDKNIEKLQTDILNLLQNTSYSLPEKEVMLAMILGRDNHHLRGIQYQYGNTLLDDGCNEPINLYVEAFNRWSKETRVLPVRGDFDLLKKYRWNSVTKVFEESPENLEALNPLPEIKRLKREILKDTSFIREKKDELTALQKTVALREDAEELRRSWHRPEGDFKTIEYEEKSLDEKYIPTPGLVVKDTVDLRKYFSPVRNQSNLGSCTSFAVTAMYESMMNRIGIDGDNIMSPAYLFYHSNILTGRPLGGSNYREQLEILAEQGICFEHLYLYDADSSFDTPSETAVEEAKKHRVITAKQLPLIKEINKVATLRRNHQLITSALSEGYPVGISLRVYDNLGNTGAFVSHPDDTPEAKEDGWHAMVIVGYSEKNNFYIVRNSWGKAFGENGYCYISSAYIDDPKYLDFACIITKISDSSEGALGDIPDSLADFAATETEIRIAAIRNAITKVRIELDTKKNLYAEYYKYYQKLLLQLTMPATQTKILQAAEAAHQALQAVVADGAGDAVPEDNSQANGHTIRYAIGSLFALAVCFGVVAGLTVGVLFPILAIVCGGLGFLMLGISKWQSGKSATIPGNKLNETMANNALQKSAQLELQMKYRVAGMWISRFHKLSIEIGRVYDRLSSYNDTLRAWQRNYFEKVNHPSAAEGQMFRTLESVALPDRLFQANRENIVRRIDLLKVFESYQANVEDLNNTLENLRNAVRNSIDSIIGEFSIANYLMGDRYPYLDSVDLQKELASLVAVGQPSYRNRVMNAMPPVRMVLANVESNRMSPWESTVIASFPPHPIPLPLIDKSMLLLLTLLPQTDEH